MHQSTRPPSSSLAWTAGGLDSKGSRRDLAGTSLIEKVRLLCARADEEEALSLGSQGWPRRPISAFGLIRGDSSMAFEEEALFCCWVARFLGGLSAGGGGAAVVVSGRGLDEAWEGLELTAAAAAAAAWLIIFMSIEETSMPFRCMIAANDDIWRLKVGFG